MLLRSGNMTFTDALSEISSESSSYTLPHVPVFDGSPSSAEGFILQLETKFLADSSHFNNDINKINYAITRLPSSLLPLLSPILTSTKPRHLKTRNEWPSFLCWFRKTVGVEDPSIKASREILTFRQGTLSTHQYVSKFESLAAHTSFNDDALFSLLENGFNIKIRRALALSDPYPGDYESLVTRSLTLDSRLSAISSENLSSKASFSSYSASSSTTSSTSRVSRKLTPEEYQNRVDNNRCIYCNAKDHLIDKCSLVPKIKVNFNKVNNTNYSPRINSLSFSSSCPVSPIFSLNSSTAPVFTLEIIVNSFRTTALLDTGACSNFIDSKFAEVLQLPLKPKSTPLSIAVVDGRPLSSGIITHQTHPLQIQMISQPVHFYTAFDVISSPSYSIILGLPWFKIYRPDIDWDHLTVKFDSKSSDVPVTSSTSHISTTSPSLLSLTPSTPIVTLPSQYQKFSSVFDENKARTLPPHRPHDLSISLLPNTKPPVGPIYSLSPSETTALKEYIDDMLSKGYIVPSQSPAASPIMFVQKGDGGLRPCVDYRALNRITIKNTYPLPLISDILEQASSAKIFTRLDLRGAYNLLRVKEEDEWKTAFRCKFGLFQYRVMPFGLANGPSVFQEFIDNLFKSCTDFVRCFVDDILIFSNNPDDHYVHVQRVLSILLQNQLFSKLEKCIFHQSSVEFLGYVISPASLSMVQPKVETILNWKEPSSVKDLQVFLGFANFYRRFIHNFAKITKPLTNLLRKNTPFQWDYAQQAAFSTLKNAFTSAPVLVSPDPTKQFILETDASDFALGCILSQYHNSKLHPVAFYSRSFQPAEINYDIHDKELLAIKIAFEIWRHHLLGATHPTLVFTDHKNLEYFTSSRTLNRRQARWSLFFSDYDFIIQYRPGHTQGKSDALSRRPEYIPPNLPTLYRPLIPPQKYQSLPIAVLTQLQDNHIHRIRTLTQTDGFATRIRQDLSNPTQAHHRALFTFDNGCLFRNGKLYVPTRKLQLELLKSHHDSITAGHHGTAKTIELLSRHYWWPHIYSSVDKYIKSCPTCARTKSSHQKPHGLLHPLPIPTRQWQSVSLDFITDLPLSQNYDSILTVVDRLTKMTHFIPCKKSISAEETAQLFIHHIFRLHGLPQDIVSDRGPQFVSQFWKHFFKLLGTKINLSSGFHPQTNGQTERLNQVVEQYLRCFLNHQQDNWVDLLPFAEFTYNNTIQTSTKMSPFKANYGFNPDFNPHLSSTPQVPAADNIVAEMKFIVAFLKMELEAAQLHYSHQANKNRNPAPVFKINDLVWLKRRSGKSSRPSHKLDYRRVGPYRITEQINDSAYRLQLPPAAGRTHNVFHVSELDTYISDPESHPHVTPSSVDWQDPAEDTIIRIIDSRYWYRRLQYLVEWNNRPITSSSWTYSKDLNQSNIQELSTEYHRLNPGKCGPALTIPIKRT